LKKVEFQHREENVYPPVTHGLPGDKHICLLTRNSLFARPIPRRPIERTTGLSISFYEMEVAARIMVALRIEGYEGFGVADVGV
jgi:hypothetical protein